MKMFQKMRCLLPVQAMSLVWMLVLVVSIPLAAETWPTYRHGRSRNGLTAERLPNDLSLHWRFVSSQTPKPAWPKPGEERPRMHSDAALHVAAAGGKVFFGSSVTDEVYAINADTGQLVWRFYTEGPVRFAPSVADDRVYVGSDDGHLYCLDARNGSLLWKYRPGPTAEKVLGNGRMISLWPVRTGVLVEDGVVYGTAGVFPYEGLYLYALDAQNGDVIWRNDTIGDHSHEMAFGGITPHGYLLASEDLLYVPTGRAMPAAFNRQTGEFHFWAAPGGKQGGTWTLLDGDRLIAGVDHSGAPRKLAYEATSGKRTGDAFAWFPGIDIVLQENIAYILTAESVYAIDRNVHAEAVEKVSTSAAQRKTLAKERTQLRDKQKAETLDAADAQRIERRIEEVRELTNQCLVEERRLRENCYLWRQELTDFESLIVADEMLFVGGAGRVVGLEARSGRQIWDSAVAGTAVGLAAAEGHLIVSTDQGHVLCFGRPVPDLSPQEIKVHAQSNLFNGMGDAENCREWAKVSDHRPSERSCQAACPPGTVPFGWASWLSYCCSALVG